MPLACLQNVSYVSCMAFPRRFLLLVLVCFGSLLAAAPAAMAYDIRTAHMQTKSATQTVSVDYAIPTCQPNPFDSKQVRYASGVVRLSATVRNVTATSAYVMSLSAQYRITSGAVAGAYVFGQAGSKVFQSGTDFGIGSNVSNKTSSWPVNKTIALGRLGGSNGFFMAKGYHMGGSLSAGDLESCEVDLAMNVLAVPTCAQYGARLGKLPLMRYWSNGRSDAALATSADQRLYSSHGYSHQATEGYVIRRQASTPPGLKPIYKLYNAFNTDHVYTSNDAFARGLAHYGYGNYGVIGYACGQYETGSRGLMLLHNPFNADHFMTTSAGTRDAAARYAYGFRGVDSYIL